jgi:uncharacterized membrane protein YciS (DUF1049 family)
LGTCYIGLNSYTAIAGTEPLTDSNFKYILANEEFSTSSFINSIQIIASKIGLIKLEVFHLFDILRFVSFKKLKGKFLIL